MNRIVFHYQTHYFPETLSSLMSYISYQSNELDDILILKIRILRFKSAFIKLWCKGENTRDQILGCLNQKTIFVFCFVFLHVAKMKCEHSLY